MFVPKPIFLNKSSNSRYQKKISNDNILSLNENLNIEKFILENMKTINDDYYTISKEFITESYNSLKINNYEMVNESFSDFIHKIVDFFKKIINAIKEFFSRAYMYIRSYIGDFNKFIEKYKDKITGMDNITFEYKMFEYTFDKSVPDVKCVKDVINSYNDTISKIQEISLTEIIDTGSEKNSTENLDNIRGGVLGLSKSITANDFIAECKRRFRNDKNEKQGIIVDNNTLNRIVKDYGNISKYLEDTKNDRMRIENVLVLLKNFFQQPRSFKYGDDKKEKVYDRKVIDTEDNYNIKSMNNDIKFNDENIKKVNTFFQIKFKHSKELSTIISNAYFEKINALKECLATYREVVRTALFSGRKQPDDKKKKKGDDDDN